MVRYAKPKQRRTEIRGLRPLPVQQLTLPANLRRETLEKMRKFFAEIMNNSRPKADFAKQELFVLSHLKTVVQFHLEKDETTKNRLNQKIWKNEEEGHQIGLNQEQIGCLNFLILEEKQKGQNQLEVLLQKLEAKMNQAK